EEEATTPRNSAMADQSAPPEEEVEPAHHPLVIVGGGIGGLVLALALDQAYNHPQIDGASTIAPPSNSDDAIPEDAKADDAADQSNSNKPRLPIHVYESTAAYKSDAGGAIGLYSNGLRVLRHLSRTHPEVPSLLADVRSAGCDYVYRRWMRHDGTEVAVAREDELLPDVDVEIEDTDDDSVGSADSNSTGSPKQQPRDDSISAPDKEGERANRRPRGGSLGNIRNTLTGGKSLGEMMQALTTKGERPSGASTESPERTTPRTSRTVEKELLSLGIRRWKYQQVLYESCVKAGIHVHFGKRLQKATSLPTSDGGDAKTLLHFKDGSQITASLLVGADGINSKVRNYVTDPSSQSDSAEYVPAYTGVTCLMGCANVPRVRGICFPSSATTKCHACYYPTRAPREGTADAPDDCEQVFQIYFPSPVERPDTWRTLTPEEAREECKELAVKLRSDGWNEQFLKPLESPTLTGVLRVGLRSREGLDCWHVGGDGSDVAEESVGRAVLLGDAAHPPVPYIGQGAQMAMEDAGTLSMLLAHYCPMTQQSESASPDLSQFSKAMAVYDSLRVSRTKAILGSSVQLGKTQQKRAESKLYNAWREMSIKAQVWAYGTLPVMRPGAAFDYRAAVEEALSAEDGRSKKQEEK
ncbi:hypothetical protein ACHAXT_003731, partial [Thalassiosira profunda]